MMEWSLGMRFETVLLVCSVELNNIMLTLKSEFCNLDSKSTKIRVTGNGKL